MTHPQQGMNIEMHVKNVVQPKGSHGHMEIMMDIQRGFQPVKHVGR